MSWYVCASRVLSYNTNSVFPWELNPPHASTVSPHRSISFPRNLTHRFGPNKVMSRVASFELFERMFITKHYFAPVLLGVGLSEPQSTTLVGFRQSRSFTLSEYAC